MFLLNQEGKYLAINPAFEKLTGYTQAELVSMSIGTITHPDDSVAVKLALKKTSVKDVLSHAGEYRIICKSGQQK